ncbi:uncharacterized protein LOC143019450 [Oratosquilla oratoria]|uniref:uncharacterized protein LOC143019450 n=1 Tax=Oratosquilla oratoria TaxID=337810 RepID=UPI003F7755F6
MMCQGEMLLKLASRIKEDLPFSSSVYNILLLHYRGHCNYYTFYQLRQHQDSHVVLYTSKSNKVGLYCKKDEVQLLEETLKTTPILDWSSNLFFFHINDYIVPIISKVALSISGRHIWSTPSTVFTFDASVDVKIKPRADVNVNLLGHTGVKVMYNSWDYNSSITEDEIQQQCLRLPAVGVYLNSETTGPANDSSAIDLDRIVRAPDENLPVSWVCMSTTGAMGLLGTQKEYLRKGFASMVAQTCTMLMVKEGYYPHVHVDEKNDPSIRLFSNLEGWKPSYLVSWVGLRSK